MHGILAPPPSYKVTCSLVLLSFKGTAVIVFQVHQPQPSPNTDISEDVWLS